MKVVGVRGVFGGRPWHVAADDGGTLGRAKLLCPVVDNVVVVQPLQGICQGQASDTDQHLKNDGMRHGTATSCTDSCVGPEMSHNHTMGSHNVLKQGRPRPLPGPRNGSAATPAT